MEKGLHQCAEPLRRYVGQPRSRCFHSRSRASTSLPWGRDAETEAAAAERLPDARRSTGERALEDAERESPDLSWI